MSDADVHVALLPSAGMGHLTPFLRLASLLVGRRVRVTLITTHPTVSLAESDLLTRFHSAFPQVNLVDFHLLPLPADADADPFWLRFEAIRRSSHLLSPLVSSLRPPLSSFVLDMTLISSVIPVTRSLSVPSFILFTSSARMFSFFSCFPTHRSSSLRDGFLHIPGITPVPESSIPPPLIAPDTLFAKIFFEDSSKLPELDGVLINSFEEFESESIGVIGGGKLLGGPLPPIFALGPFAPCEFEKSDSAMGWLDSQEEGSVVYVSFGSRTAMGKDQIREIKEGLAKSGCGFLWVVKGKAVDREEEEEEREGEGEETEQLKKRGMVVKGWVDQREILSHRSVGGFVSHCGWNSVVEAAWFGVRILAWPLHGDQRINAEVVEQSGLGIWERKWGWGGQSLVEGDEIGKRIREMMDDEALRKSAVELRDAARKAVSDGGSSDSAFRRLIGEWRKKKAVNDSEHQ